MHATEYIHCRMCMWYRIYIFPQFSDTRTLLSQLQWGNQKMLVISCAVFTFDYPCILAVYQTMTGRLLNDWPTLSHIPRTVLSFSSPGDIELCPFESLELLSFNLKGLQGTCLEVMTLIWFIKFIDLFIYWHLLGAFSIVQCSNDAVQRELHG